MRLLCCLALANVIVTSSPPHASAQGAAAPATVSLIIRTDDVGMSHSVNMGVQRLLDTGLPISVSVMFACPWYQEAVEMLTRYPNASVGIHLTLNSEWKHYRWGPVAGRDAVPSLVDSDGFFFPSAEALHHNRPDAAHVEKELRAQIERAQRSGVRIDYVDYHMGTATRYPEFQAVTERLAGEYGLGMSQYLGEAVDAPQYFAAPHQKADSLLAYVARLTPGMHLLVTHVGIDDAELGALLDMNTDHPLPDMSKHRQGELDALTSPRFAAALQSRNVQLLTYRTLTANAGS